MGDAAALIKLVLQHKELWQQLVNDCQVRSEPLRQISDHIAVFTPRS